MSSSAVADSADPSTAAPAPAAQPAVPDAAPAAAAPDAAPAGSVPDAAGGGPDAGSAPHGHPGWANRHAATRRAIEPEDLVPLPDGAPGAAAGPQPAAGAPDPAAEVAVVEPPVPDAAPPAPDAVAAPAGPTIGDLSDVDLGPDPWSRSIARLRALARTARRGGHAAFAAGGLTAAAGIGIASLAVVLTPPAGPAVSAWTSIALRAAEIGPTHWVGAVATLFGAAMLATAVASGADERVEQLARQRAREMAHRAHLQRRERRAEAVRRADADAEARRQHVAAARAAASAALDARRAEAEERARQEAAVLQAVANANADRFEAQRRVERAILAGRRPTVRILEE